MQHEPDIAPVLKHELADVQPHLHTDIDPGRPPLAGQVALPADRRRSRVARAAKREKST